MTPFVFISWSGAKSKEYASQIKAFLHNAFSFEEDDIFISEFGINGNEGWLKEVREKVSIASIVITCITPENRKSPWIHYEVGIGSYYVKPSCEPKKIIPILFDMSTIELDGNLTMLTYHQMVCEDNYNAPSFYNNLLKKLALQVDSYLINFINTDNINNLRFKIHQFKSIEQIRYDSGCKINEYANRLKKIREFYTQKDFFISRPIKGIDIKQCNDISELLAKIANNNKIFFADGKSGSQDLIISRLAIIKSCGSFILIYPNVSDEEYLPPSSCLIEFGMALALNKQIFILIESGAKIPYFIDSLSKRALITKEYHNISELTTQIMSIID